jgi:NTP pyrophosphatase (non-canonical NTP hydrolase)
LDNLTLNEVQKVVDKWISQFEEGYWPPLSMLAAVVEETGELAREINDLEGFKKKRMTGDTDIGMELADLIFSIICIANYYHIDLNEAFKAILDKYTKRDMQRWTLKGKNQDEDTNNLIQDGN